MIAMARRGLAVGSALLIFAAALLAACGGDRSGGTAATPTLSATATSVSAKSDECIADVPSAALRSGALTQDGARTTIHWQGADCYTEGHPIDTVALLDTVALPAQPLIASAGAPLDLAFSRTPLSASAFAWQPDFATAQPGLYDDVVVPFAFNARRSATNVELAIEPAATQQLSLDALPPGDYALEISATWPEGSLTFIFRVQIEPDETEP
jgi:hypothetical protein